MRYCVEAAQLHAQFGSEILDLAKHSAITGEPILRHMAYEFPEEGMETIQDQFMLGGSLLVAPVIVKGLRTRNVTFSFGIWIGDDGTFVEGPTNLQIDVPLGRLPWYRKR
ncbi:hypothetical protein [Paenibacillus aceris]|uniref:Alpha-glucosidase (Family GH31 glycosyl hydrolase) n=1 Tax=Paenibacillus aceris TaxID=869555 RepID=A0ABS4I8A9_9BACL|nr:alpha-glucosidase (family GH31 glycosyl hydrolase) [Paenibacillus aceris]